MFTLSIEQHLIDDDYREAQLAAGTHLLDPDTVTEQHDTLAGAWARVMAIAQEHGTVPNLYGIEDARFYIRFDGPEEGETQGYVILTSHPPVMRTRDALQTVLDAEKGSVDSGRWAEAMKVLRAILDQRGCEHFDPAVDDGRLTSLMDVVIFG